MLTSATAQCPVEKCRNDEAYWFALQIRSADEPMTNFYKVSTLPFLPFPQTRRLLGHSVQSAPKSGANSPPARITRMHQWSFGSEQEVCITIYPGFLAQSISSTRSGRN